FIPGVTDFPKPAVIEQPQLASSGSELEWNNGLSVGIAALVLALALGLGLGYLKRPKLAL
ncbi:MAG: hypothetical protein M3R12_06915, partial [Actinomycetota bacterium]|nr:hypothetical protein [Actinomycetota bacterium]